MLQLGPRWALWDRPGGRRVTRPVRQWPRSPFRPRLPGPVMWQCRGWASCPRDEVGRPLSPRGREGGADTCPALGCSWGLPPLWGGLRLCRALLPTFRPVEGGPQSLTRSTSWHGPPPEATTLRRTAVLSRPAGWWGPAQNRHQHPPVLSAFLAWLWSCHLIRVVLSHRRLQAHLGRLHWHVAFGAGRGGILCPGPWLGLPWAPPTGPTGPAHRPRPSAHPTVPLRRGQVWWSREALPWLASVPWAQTRCPQSPSGWGGGVVWAVPEAPLWV